MHEAHSADRTIRAELPVPKRRVEVVGVLFGIALMGGFVLFFVGLAVWNLVHGVGLIQSGVWLLLVGAVTWGCFQGSGGWRLLLIKFVGLFTTRHSIVHVADGDRPAEVWFGYRVFGRRFDYVRVPVDKIKSVDWHTGQLSDQAGRDVNDWRVMVWFYREKAGRDLHFVSSEGPKEDVAAFGLELVAFLRDAGAKLVEGDDDCAYARETSP